MWLLPQGFLISLYDLQVSTISSVINRATIQFFSQVLMVHFNINPSIYTPVSEVLFLLEIIKTKILQAFYISPIRDACPVNL
jgi:hypothetical protein